ncbi:MAG TPA: single-stranded DNA-binding protein [Candidatus Pelethomonas intestinigallinarum]|nr:single-stranded DNA-binding protein [Candidatus Pelethomonas intestinigallinarum]
MDETRNDLLLRGTAAAEPAFSHENHGQRFYRFPLSVRRLSGQADVLQVIATGEQLSHLLPLTGRRLEIQGQLRSFNNKSGQGSRLVISAFTRLLVETAGEDVNIIELKGAICKPPVLRRTPLGRCICDMMLAVNRRYGRADYLPCIAWGQVAMVTGQLPVGSTLALEGRVQSRVYTKVLDGVPQERTAYEVSIMRLQEDPS